MTRAFTHTEHAATASDIIQDFTAKQGASRLELLLTAEVHTPFSPSTGPANHQ